MGIVNRASLPEEFFDVTSARMLIAPEPQFFFAQLAKLALGSALALAMGTGGISPGRGVPVTGVDPGQYQVNARLQLVNQDPQTNQAIQMIAELGKAPGHTVRLNRPRFGSGGFTLASREITSGTSISTTAIDLSGEQATVTLKRYGGPFDTVQSAVAPFAIDRFDSSLGLHSLVSYVGLHMQRDLDKWLDSVIAALLGAGSTTLWPQGFSADASSQIAGDMPGDIDILFRGIETLKNANVPQFADGKYRAVISATFARQLKGDPQAAQYIRYDAGGANPVTGMQGGFLGAIAGCNLFESTTLVSTNNAQSVPVVNNLMFGPGMVGAGVGQLPRVAYSSDDNYGEHAKMVWLSYLGFNLLDARFGVQMHTT